MALPDPFIDSVYRAGAGRLAESAILASGDTSRIPRGLTRRIRESFTLPSGERLSYEQARNIVRRAARSVDAGSRLEDATGGTISRNRLPIDPFLSRDATNNFSYRVIVELTEPITGEHIRRPVLVVSPSQLARDEVIARAIQAASDDTSYVGPSSTIPVGGYQVTYARIVSAGRKG